MARFGNEIHQNYLDTFYRCISKSKMICHDMIEEHKLVYIMSGRLTLRSGAHRVDIENGQAVFVRRNHLVKEFKQTGDNGEPFKGLFFHLNSSDLRDIKDKIAIPVINGSESLEKGLAITLAPHPFLKGLFISLDKYFALGDELPTDLIKAKTLETVIILLQIMPELAPILFDFSKEWKSDLKSFMEKNFLCDMSLEQFAHFAGRSLSGFKREFNGIFNQTPHQWIMAKRLDYSKTLIKSGKYSLSDIYIKAGFKNPSHFSTCFKKYFGETPSEYAFK